MILPAFISFKPISSFAKVDFPEPLCPIKQTYSPAYTSKFKSLRVIELIRYILLSKLNRLLFLNKLPSFLRIQHTCTHVKLLFLHYYVILIEPDVLF